MCGLSRGMELASPTPSMHLPAFSGVGPEGRALQLRGCQGKEADRAQWGWAEPPDRKTLGTNGSPSGTPDFMCFAPVAKHGSSGPGQEGAGQVGNSPFIGPGSDLPSISAHQLLIS